SHRTVGPTVPQRRSRGGDGSLLRKASPVVGGMTADYISRVDRNKLTRQKLLDTTVECLMSHGWAMTTVGLIAEKAGISRGALQHYYRTREDLITAALDHMWSASADHIMGELRD